MDSGFLDELRWAGEREGDGGVFTVIIFGLERFRGVG